MIYVRSLSLSFSLFLLLGNAQADCELSSNELTQTNRVFATRDGSSYQLLRKDVFPNNAEVYSICDANNIVRSKCTGNNFNPPLATTGCTDPIKPVVEPRLDSSCSYTMYRVGYNVKNLVFLEIYRSCYDPAQIQTHFSIYMASTSTSNVERPDHFTTDRVISGADAASFQNPKIYARYNDILGSSQTYFSAGELMYDRGHLTPSLDFAFEDSRKQTNKYINLMPQFSTINRGNWKTIENWVRRQLTDGHFDALKVCTGVLDVLELYSTTHSAYMPMFLIDKLNPRTQKHELKNPVPKWMYKIVSHISGRQYVFLTYNNAHANTPRPSGQDVSSICREIPCRRLRLNVRDEARAGYTFCCDATHFIRTNVPRLTGVC